MKRRDLIKLIGIGAISSFVFGVEKSGNKNRNHIAPVNPNKLTPFELKHTPQITLGTTDAKGYTQVNITVGSGGIIHPSVKNHWIDFITLYADGKKVGHTELEPVVSRGGGAFLVNLSNVKALKCEAGCNLHGIYTATLKV